MEKTLLAEGDYFHEGKVRIYKTDDGKFFCEEIRRSAELDSEIDVVKFCGTDDYGPLLVMYDAAGISRAAYDLAWHLENENLRRHSLLHETEQLINEMKSVLERMA